MKNQSATTNISDRNNAFDALRLLLAICVVVSHACLLSGNVDAEPLKNFSKGQTDLGEIGVMGFFSLSGFLTTASSERLNNIGAFISHRVLRIFPGYWVCLLVTAFAIAPVMYYLNTGSIHGFSFWGESGAGSYVIHNSYLRMNQWTIQNILANAAYDGSFNGSLWTLFPEMQCYLFVMIAGIFGLFSQNKWILTIITLAILAYFGINQNTGSKFGPTIITLTPSLKLYASFMCGATLWTYKHNLHIDAKGMLFIGLFTLTLLKFGGFHLLSPVLIAIISIGTFQLFALSFKYDISYGVYIYSFPLQQLLYAFFKGSLSLPVFILLSLSLSAMAGFLSFILVEKPALRMKRTVTKLLGSFPVLNRQ